MRLRTEIFRGNLHPCFRDAEIIRTAVFIEEQGFANEFDDIDKTSYHIVVYDASLPIATARLFTCDGVYCVGRVAVLSSRRKSGVGAFLMNKAEDFARTLGAEELALSAQVRAMEFYSRCGYTSSGDIYSDEGCSHIKMSKRI